MEIIDERLKKPWRKTVYSGEMFFFFINLALGEEEDEMSVWNKPDFLFDFFFSLSPPLKIYEREKRSIIYQ